MQCREIEGQWEDWLSGRAAAELEGHLRECARCRQLAAELARTPNWLAVLREEPPDPGAAFWVRLRQRLEESQRGRDLWPALGWLAGRTAAVLAVVVLLLAVGLWQQPPEGVVPDFDAPQAYLDPLPGSIPVGNGQLSRDQVAQTLLAQAEEAR